MTNLDIVAELYRAFHAKDYDAFVRLCDANIEWIQNEGFPGGGCHRGAQAIIDGVFRVFDSRWTRFGYEIERMMDAGDAVLVVGRYSGVHRETGKSFSAAAAHLYELSGKKLIRYRQFADTKMIWDAMT